MLQVTDAVGGMVHIRVLVTAVDAPTLFDLRCFVREEMVRWLREQRPEALPRTRVLLTERGGRRRPRHAGRAATPRGPRALQRLEGGRGAQQGLHGPGQDAGALRGLRPGGTGKSEGSVLVLLGFFCVFFEASGRPARFAASGSIDCMRTVPTATMSVRTQAIQVR